MSQSQPPHKPDGAASSGAPKRAPHASASYHPRGYDTSEGLRRARRPYFAKNMAMGVALAGFMLGVGWYTVGKVHQDDFSDVVPTAVTNNVHRAEDHLDNNSEAVQQKLRQASNDVKERFDSASQSADKELHNLRSKFDEERSHLESQAHKGADKAKESWSASREELDRLAARTKEEASSLSDRSKKEAERLASQSRENLDSLTQSARSNASKLSEQAQSSFADVRSSAESAWTQTRNSTEEHLVRPARASIDSAVDSLPAAKDLHEGVKSRILPNSARVWEDWWAVEGRRRRAELIALRDHSVPGKEETKQSGWFS